MTQQQALRVMLSGASVFLTGPPGAGKTFVLNEFVRRASRRGSRIAVTASTGIAATHVGGSTLHSWSGLGTSRSLRAEAQSRLHDDGSLHKRYRETDVLVIDEVSMLHGCTLDVLDAACRRLRGSRAPFGGLQVILAGDLFQLPPVTMENGPPDFAHTSAAWTALRPVVCYLDEQHRQQDDPLLDLLQAMRGGNVRPEHVRVLHSRLYRQPPPGTAAPHLCTHNREADAINRQQVAALDAPGRTYGMDAVGAAPKVAQLTESVLAPVRLELRIGAAVLFTANSPADDFVNGTRGRVVGFRRDLPTVQLSTGRIITVRPHRWVLIENGHAQAEIVQLPLQLGWAMTIHKSQGLTLDAAVLDLRACFTPGMGYVALSRVRSLRGIYLTGMNDMALRVHPEAIRFDQEVRRQLSGSATRSRCSWSLRGRGRGR